ncbi:MAG: hypothetical protein KDK39_05895 [Leptospiraceae bacterium]|nr:hypothetical protein [Leptospiraceae bacterium]
MQRFVGLFGKANTSIRARQVSCWAFVSLCALALLLLDACQERPASPAAYADFCKQTVACDPALQSHALALPNCEKWMAALTRRDADSARSIQACVQEQQCGQKQFVLCVQLYAATLQTPQ